MHKSGRSVRDLAVFDDGAGTRLYAGGNFVEHGGLARWSGTAWSPVPDFPYPPSGRANVYALLVWDDGMGPALFVAMEDFGAPRAPSILKWDGVTWKHAGIGLHGPAYCLAVHDEGQGPMLVSAGFAHVSRLRDGVWARIADLRNSVSSMSSFHDGHQRVLAITGSLLEINKQPVGGVAYWDGNMWSSMDGSPSGAVLTVFDAGWGPRLFVGGIFETAGGKPSANIASGSDAEPIPCRIPRLRPTLGASPRGHCPVDLVHANAASPTNHTLRPPEGQLGANEEAEHQDNESPHRNGWNPKFQAVRNAVLVFINVIIRTGAEVGGVAHAVAVGIDVRRTRTRIQTNHRVRHRPHQCSGSPPSLPTGMSETVPLERRS